VELCVKRKEKKQLNLKNSVIIRTTPKPIFINLSKDLKVATASVDYDSAILVFLYYEQIPRSKGSEPTTDSTHIIMDLDPGFSVMLPS